MCRAQVRASLFRLALPPVSDCQDAQGPPQKGAGIQPEQVAAFHRGGQRRVPQAEQVHALHPGLVVGVGHGPAQPIALPQELLAQGRVLGFYLLTLDISARKQLEVALQQMALQDALTGLPNRRAMMAQLPAAMARSARSGLPLALLFMDLDGFQGVNDSLGHDAGDAVLREFARRIRQQVREVDVLYRLAGDEFILLLENLHMAPDEAQTVGQKICQAMVPPFCLEAGEARLSTSIGVALYWPHQPRAVAALVAAADQAMYAAKRAGKNGIYLAQQ